MSESLGNAYINIVPKAPGIEGNINSLLGNPATGAGENAGKKAGNGLLSALKGAAITAGVSKILKDSFSAGGDLQQSFGGLDTIYGDAAEAAKQYAVEAAQAGISANDYAEQAVSFGASLKQAFGGDVTAAAEAANTAIMDMADNSAKMGTDINSVQDAYQGFAKQNYTMLDNLKLGYGGTKTEMERLLADAQKLTGVKYDINNLGDVYDAIHAVQTELGITGVAAAEAQTTLTGSFASLRASWTNLMAALTTGEGLDAAIANLTASFGNFGNNIITMLNNLAPQLPTMIMSLVDSILTQLPAFLEAGAQLIGELLLGIAQKMPELIGQLPGLFIEAGAAILSVDWLSVGRDIIYGIGHGIENAASSLFSSLRDLASRALQAAKSALGIGSPSKLFAAEVGEWIPPGVSVGIEDNMKPLDNTLNNMIDPSSMDFMGQLTSGQWADKPSRTTASVPAAQAVPKIEISFTGSLAQLARVLQPEISMVDDWHGPKLINA